LLDNKIILHFWKKAYICNGFTEKMGRLRKKAFFRTVNQDKRIMEFKKRIEELLNEFLETRKDLFLID
jgi:ribosome maturation factor RimP